ncbi:hypothetical protein P8C59_005433 [Phyllachora maydis]|uniref:PPM-type phosphatase domain-containing protein n=1 Tax=Phyllachora maydis TaxID=1825666 RepID=A0AAD9I4N6_9PEZI|nr:hypothetical protein P8C59_005433 [Phyllachora maydis]
MPTSKPTKANALPPASALLDALFDYLAARPQHARPHGGAAGGVSRARKSSRPPWACRRPPSLRCFHNYFVTHLPSSSLHPDPGSIAGPHHKLPRSASTPHTAEPGSSRSQAVVPPDLPDRNNVTVVRIPLRSAKHHFGASNSRGSRVYNEDTNQAGTINMPAFAKRSPVSLVRSQLSRSSGEGTNADSAFGDPQVFYFAVFDGHGGAECSDFLRDELHGYVEEAAEHFALQSSLRRPRAQAREGRAPDVVPTPVPVHLESELVQEYRDTVGGYFRRFRPIYFNLPPSSSAQRKASARAPVPDEARPAAAPATVETVLTYAFLRADLDFITAQARKPDPDDPYVADIPLNKDEVLGHPSHRPPSGHGIGGPSRFKGGSTASLALISTPTPAPFWHPAAQSTLVVAHVGDTRVLLCETASGLPIPLTSDHHPSAPSESRRLMRYAADSLVTDSFGEERIAGLANSRAFGDMQSKRVGVSAEPDITRVDLGPAQYSFLVLMSDGVSGSLSDQEIVDVVKEARTPDEGARKVVEYATEVSSDGDNATCLVVRLGGWERRSEGGLGSLGTKEIRDVRRAEALDPRRGRQ